MASEISDARTPAADSTASGRSHLSRTADNGLKIVIVGGFGVGKTTLVRSVSEIRPLNTEETMTRAGEAVDHLDGVSTKSSTTVAFDFGRISVNDRTVLYLFGAPGQERFWFLWDRLFSGTLGAVVLVDTRRLADSWYAIDRLEHHGTPFVVARNDFGGPPHTDAQVREALDLADEIPMVTCDARDRASSKHVLITLVEHLHALATTAHSAAAPATTAQSAAAPAPTVQSPTTTVQSTAAPATTAAQSAAAAPQELSTPTPREGAAL